MTVAFVPFAIDAQWPIENAQKRDLDVPRSSGLPGALARSAEARMLSLDRSGLSDGVIQSDTAGSPARTSAEGVLCDSYRPLCADLEFERSSLWCSLKSVIEAELSAKSSLSRCTWFFRHIRNSRPARVSATPDAAERSSPRTRMDCHDPQTSRITLRP